MFNGFSSCKGVTFKLASSGAHRKGGGLEILYPAIPGDRSITKQQNKVEKFGPVTLPTREN